MALHPRSQSAFDLITQSSLPPGVAPLLEQLLATNARQWDLEDRTRDPRHGADLPHLKKAIDASNRQRNAMIAAIDRVIISEFRPPLYDVRGGLAKNSESVGRLLDRLSISVVRQGFLDEGETLTMVQSEFRYQLTVLGEVLAALRDGTASYAPEVNAKDYRPR